MAYGTSKREHAYRLGSIDAYAGRPMRDMQDADSAWLMTELGITSETTERNHAYRVRLCDAYEDGFYDARSALGGLTSAASHECCEGYDNGFGIECDDDCWCTECVTQRADR